MDLVNEGFENIAGLLLEMQKRMQQMVAENQQLREQLAALRRGEGLMVVIEGQAYPLLTAPMLTGEPVRTSY
jgi:hypothetical protein